jgi:hypothetical protein
MTLTFIIIFVMLILITSFKNFEYQLSYLSFICYPYRLFYKRIEALNIKLWCFFLDKINLIFDF